MNINYIYYILILFLIVCIIFLIYLSYDNNNNLSYDNIESFSGIPRISPLKQINWNVNNQANSILKNYNSYYNNAYNAQIKNENLKLYNLLDTSKENLNNSENLLRIKSGIKPPPSVFPVDKLIKTIKSNYNSQFLSTIPNNVNNYEILVNDKCLTVKGLCKGEFCTQDCQKKLYTSDSQKFETKRIKSAYDAAKIMNVNVSKISSNNVYPYNIFTSLVNNNCLSINNDGVTVEPCNLNNIQQQWQISPDENICVLE